MNDKKIHMHCFVYKGDADIIHETVMCALQALPELHMVVVDDANNPCPDEVREAVEKLGAEWRASTWSRGGNLRGKACILGILSEMLASAQSDDDILIKIDADTCFMNAGEVLAFANDPEKVLLGSGSYETRLYGCFYCMKAHVVKRTIEYVKTLDLIQFAPEDIFIGFSVIKLFPEKEKYTFFSTTEQHTKWTAYSWWNYPDARKYRTASMITTGNRPPEPLHKGLRVNVMKNLRTQAASYIKELKEKAAQAE